MDPEAAGHTPYMGVDLFPGDQNGAEVKAIDTIQYAWDFCSRFARASAPVLKLVKTGGLDKSELDSGNSAHSKGPQEIEPPVSETTDGSSGTHFYNWKWATAQSVMLWLTFWVWMACRLSSIRTKNNIN